MSRMEDRYRLVFRGETLDGQHAAVVKKRLGTALKLTDEKLDQLFSGQAVIIAKAADAPTTAKLQGTFKKAGARLRALKVGAQDAKSTPQATQPTPPAEASSSIDVLPVGADVLKPEERAETPAADIDTAHLAIDETESQVAQPNEASPPDVSHITVSDVGETLSEAHTEEAVEIEVDFEVAELGSQVSDPKEAPEPAVDVDEVEFDLAEPGATLLEERAPKNVPQPDTSHIRLERE